MKKTCKNCQFWERVVGNSYQQNFGICSSEKFVDMSKSLFYHNKIKDNICFSDTDDMCVYFRTGESFGCIHFKKKEI